jgi:hypothetical protein
MTTGTTDKGTAEAAADRKGSAALRRVLLFALLAALIAGGWNIARGPADPFADAEARLAARVDEYLELRRQDDWVSLYALAAPEHRQRVDIASFLGMYGHGVMRVVEIEAVSSSIDGEARTASVALKTEAELVPAKLPPQYRASLKEEHPEHLRRSIEHDLAWVWRADDWYFEMDPEIVTGRDASGSQIVLQRLEQP